MDQAHYLLERNRVRDLGLQTADLGDLDANSVNGIRLDSLRQLVSGSVSFDASIGPANKAKLTDYDSKMTRYNALRSQRDGIRARQDTLATELATAKRRADVANALTGSDSALAKAEAQGEVDRLTALKSQSEDEYKQLTTEMGDQPTVPTLSTGTAPDAPMSAGLGEDANFKTLLGLYAKGADSTKIAASIRLDNYVNLQYEMVAKQLTLLRDQAGPDKKVLFLELPQSIYVTNKLRVYPYLGGWWGAHVLQTWWRLDEALLADPLQTKDVNTRLTDDRPPTQEELHYLTDHYPDFFKNATKELQIQATEWNAEHNMEEKVRITTEQDNSTTYQSASLSSFSPTQQEDIVSCLRGQIALLAYFHPENACSVLFSSGGDLVNHSLDKKEILDKKNKPTVDRPLVPDATTPPSKPNPYQDARSSILESESPSNYKEFCKGNFHGSDLERICNYANGWEFNLLLSPLGRANHADEEHRAFIPALSSAAAPLPMYALDLIPRQSALNVADANLTSHSYGFSGLFKFLSGVGVSTRYERQRNQFSQFIQQETYASAFGKGSYEFGWTFGPLPGTNRLAPGLRTTYAVIVVPQSTRFIRLYGMGCGYRRRNVPYSPFAIEAQETRTRYEEQHRMDGEQCSSENIFDVEVPSSEDDFHVEEVRYSPVASGQRVTVELDGRFGDQIGLMVNGTPLQKVPSIGQPTLLPTAYIPPSNTSETGIQGVFELVHTGQLIASFVMPSTFLGTPHLTLVTAGRAGLLDEFDIWPTGNEDEYRRPYIRAKPMFTQLAAIDRVETFPVTGHPDWANAKIYGRGFPETDQNTLIIGTTPLTLQSKRIPKPNPGDPLIEGEYRRITRGILEASFKREPYFPHWSLDYITHGNSQTYDAPFKWDDDLPPSLNANRKKTCSYEVTTKPEDAPATAQNDKTKSAIKAAGTKAVKTNLALTVNGDFFADAYPLTLDEKKFGKDITPLRVSSKLWTATGEVPVGWQNGSFFFKGPNRTDAIAISECENKTKPPVSTPRTHSGSRNPNKPNH